MTLYNVIWQRSRNVSQTFSQRSHNVDLLAGYLSKAHAVTVETFINSTLSSIRQVLHVYQSHWKVVGQLIRM